MSCKFVALFLISDRGITQADKVVSRSAKLLHKGLTSVFPTHDVTDFPFHHEKYYSPDSPHFRQNTILFSRSVQKLIFPSSPFEP